MFPYLIRKRSDNKDYIALFLLGLLSTVVGIGIILGVFGFYHQVLAPVLIAVPWIPVFRRRLEDYSSGKEYFSEQSKTYISLFSGEVVGFIGISAALPGFIEAPTELAETTGYAFHTESFILQILYHNLTVFFIIFVLAALIGSVGAIIISWNASVVGIIFGSMLVDNPFDIIWFLPHTSMEMGGFIVAGLAGTLASRLAKNNLENTDYKLYLKYLGLGLFLIALGAIVEST